MPVDPKSDLAWQAFLYVSGDLSTNETSEFEDHLLEDQAAREAVASAVELIQAVGIVRRESSQILSIPRRSRKTPTLVAAILLASAAMVLASFLVPASKNPTKTTLDASEVALAWSGLHGGIDADWKAVTPGLNSPGEPIDQPNAFEAEETGEAATERPLPSWLLSAASAPRVEPPLEEN